MYAPVKYMWYLLSASVAIYSLFPIDVGTEFTISSLSCVNYTAEFSWHVQLRLADTLLQLSCHNGTHVRGLGSSVYYLGDGPVMTLLVVQ